MESFTNLGPILDMAVVDLERQGQGQVRMLFTDSIDCNVFRIYLVVRHFPFKVQITVQ
jgi:hypothetical protein